MQKKLNKGISCFVTGDMFDAIHRSSEKREISVSSLLRSLIRDFLKSENTEKTNIGEGSQNDNVRSA